LECDYLVKDIREGVLMNNSLQATLPERVAGREEARKFLSDFLQDRTTLSGVTVTIHGDSLQASGTSYIDELIKQILESFGAKKLILDDVPSQAADDAKMSAERRGVIKRLTIVRR
jgi:hypothetical protein